jgi:ribonucleoside-diphosphate reductase alpha subunit
MESLRDFIKDLCNKHPTIAIPNIDISTLNQFHLNQLSHFIAFSNPSDYNCNRLAGRVEAYRLHMTTPSKFSDAMMCCRDLLSPEFIEKVQKYKEIIDSAIKDEKDFDFDYFSMQTLQKSYLLKCKDKIIERPQYMFMRVATFIGDSISEILEIYEYLSDKYFIFATPTLFNSGLNHHQLSSCFLVDIKEDSIKGIYDTLLDCALISKNSGGIGLSIHKIRAEGSLIKGTGGKSNGIIPMLRVFNETARYVDQCFSPDSLVYCRSGWKRIDQVTIEDNVMTRDSTYKKVQLKKVFDYSGPAYRIKTELGECVVTPNHPILTNIYGTEIQTFIEAKNLGIGSKLPIPLIPYPRSKITILEHQLIENYQGTMYDLEIEENHNYFTVIGIAHNGGGKRKGVITVYLEPWHADIFSFIEMKRNTGKEEFRVKDLFYALWIPDLFMKRVLDDEEWTLFSPDTAPGLQDVYGKEFEELYERYEKEGRGIRKVKSRTLWNEILKSQIETGGPFMLYKDTCNRCSNQKNLGTIKSSNLCTEIIEYSDKDNISVCNLASISLPRFVNSDFDCKNKFRFDFDKLKEIVSKITKYLNRVIDINKYPNDSSRISNLNNRPIGIGVQGLADVFMKLRIPYSSKEARELNIKIFETIYYAAIEESRKLASSFGSYPSFEGSPYSKGILHPELYESNIRTLKSIDNKIQEYVSPVSLRMQQTEGSAQDSNVHQSSIPTASLMRNSLLIALMPTASTSQILGNIESFEPIFSNIFVRRTNSGDFVVVNKYLVEHLKELSLWNDKIKDAIVLNDGSIQNIPEIPQDVKEIYKTVFEIRQKDLVEMAIDRGYFVDQSQSMNLYISNPDNIMSVSTLHFYAWKNGLKTGMYYLRTKSTAKTIKFTIESGELFNLTSKCNGDVCKMCQS